MIFQLPPPVLVVTLSLPDSKLYPRGGCGSSWHGKSKKIAAHRLESAQRFATAMVKHRIGMLDAVTIRPVFYFKSRRNFRDRDNCGASLKSAIDGMESPLKGRPGAGLVANDKDVTMLPCSRLVDNVKPRVEIRVYAGAVEFTESE